MTSMNNEEFNNFKKYLLERGYKLNWSNISYWESPDYCGHTVIKNVMTNFLGSKGIDFKALTQHITNNERFYFLKPLISALKNARRIPIENPSKESVAIIALLIALRENPDELIATLITERGWLTNQFFSLFFYYFGFKQPSVESFAPTTIEQVKSVIKDERIEDVLILLNKGEEHWVIINGIIEQNGRLLYTCYDPDPDASKNPTEFIEGERPYIFVYKNKTPLGVTPEKLFNLTLSGKYDTDINTEFMDVLIREFGRFEHIACQTSKLDNKIEINYEYLATAWEALKKNKLPQIISVSIKDDKLIPLFFNLDKRFTIRDESIPSLTLLNINHNHNINEVTARIRNFFLLKPDGVYNCILLYDNELDADFNSPKEQFVLESEKRGFSVVKKDQNIQINDSGGFYLIIKKDELTFKNLNQTYYVVDYATGELLNPEHQVRTVTPPLTGDNPLTALILFANSVVEFGASFATEQQGLNSNLIEDLDEVIKHNPGLFTPFDGYTTQLEIILRIMQKLCFHVQDSTSRIILLKMYTSLFNKIREDKELYKNTLIPALLNKMWEIMSNTWTPIFFSESVFSLTKLLISLIESRKNVFNGDLKEKKQVYLGEAQKVSKFAKVKEFFEWFKGRKQQNRLSKKESDKLIHEYMEESKILEKIQTILKSTKNRIITSKYLNQKARKPEFDTDYFLVQEFNDLILTDLKNAISFFFFKVLKENKGSSFLKERADFLNSNPDFYESLFLLLFNQVFIHEHKEHHTRYEQKLISNCYADLRVLYDLLSLFSEDDESINFIKELFDKLPLVDDKLLDIAKSEAHKEITYNPAEDKKDPVIQSLVKLSKQTRLEASIQEIEDIQLKLKRKVLESKYKEKAKKIIEKRKHIIEKVTEILSQPELDENIVYKIKSLMPEQSEQSIKNSIKKTFSLKDDEPLTPITVKDLKARVLIGFTLNDDDTKLIELIKKQLPEETEESIIKMLKSRYALNEYDNIFESLKQRFPDNTLQEMVADVKANIKQAEYDYNKGDYYISEEEALEINAQDKIIKILKDLSLLDIFKEKEENTFSINNKTFFNKFDALRKIEDPVKKLQFNKAVQILMHYIKHLTELFLKLIKDSKYIRIYKGVIVIYDEKDKSSDQISRKKLGSAPKFDKKILEELNSLMNILIEYSETPTITPDEVAKEFVKISTFERILDNQLPNGKESDQLYDIFLRWVLFRVWLFATEHSNTALIFAVDKEKRAESLIEKRLSKEELVNIIFNIEKNFEKIVETSIKEIIKKQ